MRVKPKEVYEILVGLLMLLVGFILPYLMVIRVIVPNLELSLFSYAISLIGLVLGLHGIYGLVASRKTKKGRE